MVRAEARLYPSEDPAKVQEAVTSLIRAGEPRVDVKAGLVELESEDDRSLGHIYIQLRSRQTLGVARRLLREHADDDCTWIFFNKQAAFVGVASICEEDEESPLGAIRLQVCCRDIEGFIDWLAPG